MSKPPALPGDSQSLTVSGMQNRYSGQVKRDPESRKNWIPAFAGMTTIRTFAID